MDETLAWLLDPAEPAVRAQALVDLAGRAPDDGEARAARRESVTRGSVARVLEGLVVPEDPNGLYVPKYGATFHRLVALAEMGAPGDEPRIARALDASLAFFAKPDGGFGRTRGHLCVTGNMVRAATRLGRGDDPRVLRGVEWLVEKQLPDGGWHCFDPEDRKGTLDSWEALGAFAVLPPAHRTPSVRRAIARGVGFLLDQGLGVHDDYAAWQRLHFPRHYYYDVLVGLDLATALGDPKDPRLAPALDLLERKRDARGRWRLDATHPDLSPGDDYTPHHASYRVPVAPLTIEEPGAPSRWATLYALRVLKRAGRL